MVIVQRVSGTTDIASGSDRCLGLTMMTLHRPLACVLFATMPLSACSSNDNPAGGGEASSGDPVVGGTTSNTDNEGPETGQPTTESGEFTGSEDGGTEGAVEGPCYAESTVGCTSVSWDDIVQAIAALYFFEPSYAGYSESEALEIARELYDNGVPARSYLEIVSAYTTEGGYRMHVVVTDPQGQPVGDLADEDFAIVVDGEPLDSPASVTMLGEADPQALDLALNFSLVIDDSGSVADCDANFVAQGLAYLVNNIPPAYSMSLIKFSGTVELVQAATTDPELLADALLNSCTDRGSTALWDALRMGHDQLPHENGFDATIVFTDGLDNSSSANLANVIADHAETGTPVFVLGLGLPDIFSLTNLAAGTDGAFVYVNSGERIVEGFETLTEFIHKSYVVDLEAAPDSVEISIGLPSGTVSDEL